jgi:WD40 repeat protein
MSVHHLQGAAVSTPRLTFLFVTLSAATPPRYAVRRVVWSPHAASLLASCSYDMSVKLWDTAAPEEPLRAR